MANMENLKFRVSSGLKNIIGRELITDKFIAIFEIVKNSYDAGATRVDIRFDNINSDDAIITISDNGCGMDENDIVNKWLFVAYSEKSKERLSTFRDEFEKQRTYAGAKGVGRFSCDRLGSELELYSRKSSQSKVNYLKVDWDKFEEDYQEEFINIPVIHTYVDSLPNEYNIGTAVVVKKLRETWDRDSLLELKKSLAKLVNPYEDENNIFNIHIICEDEEKKDSISLPKNRVNGRVENYVFETLNLKTTQISVIVSEDGETIATKMFDRGTFLFELVQSSKFLSLKNVHIELFYLNRSAKLNFRKIMGMEPVKFGSIFIYKNGFRVLPYGEPGADIFSIDKRKAQGYKRFLSTRDLMGRVTILGDNQDFIETSSRDGGFINTKAFSELTSFYMDFVHKPLEKYVVELIGWGDISDKYPKEILPEDIKKEIIKYVTSYEKKGEILSLDINSDLYEIVESRKDKKANANIEALKSLARQYNNYELDILTQKVEKQNQELREDRHALINQVEKISETLENKNTEIDFVKKQALFLRALTSPKIENATAALHSINTYADSISKNINSVMKDISKISDIGLTTNIQNKLYEALQATQKIMSTYTIVLKADYDMQLQTLVVDMHDFIQEFIYNAFIPKIGKLMKINIKPPNGNVHAKINTMEFGIVIENVLYNSYKAKAKKLDITISELESFVEITFSDDGNGLNEAISEPNRIFELGFTTTNGSGVGLAHSKKIIEKMGGNILLNLENDTGFELKVRIKK